MCFSQGYIIVYRLLYWYIIYRKAVLGTNYFSHCVSVYHRLWSRSVNMCINNNIYLYVNVCVCVLSYSRTSERASERREGVAARYWGATLPVGKPHAARASPSLLCLAMPPSTGDIKRALLLYCILSLAPASCWCPLSCVYIPIYITVGLSGEGWDSVSFDAHPCVCDARLWSCVWDQHSSMYIYVYCNEGNFTASMELIVIYLIVRAVLVLIIRLLCIVNPHTQWACILYIGINSA